MESVRAIKHFSNAKVAVPLSLTKGARMFIQLPNGMLVLLISDPSYDIAACSLTCAVGSHLDPPELPGLAHLVEHMLFRGNENFPNPDYLEQLITSSGGSTNANTTGEQTSFFFQCRTTTENRRKPTEEPIFNRILEAFAKMFVNPSFHSSVIKKEVIAIDNENQINIRSKSKILYHGLRLLADDQHAFHHFHTGDIQTLGNAPSLKKMNLRDIASKFYRKYYDPAKMTLIIKGPQSLNSLQKLAFIHFSKLKGLCKTETVTLKSELYNFRILADSYNYQNTNIFKPHEATLILKPSAVTSDIMRIHFPIIALMNRQELLFTRGWCHLYGDETRGSICEYLKSKNLITGLSAFTMNIAQGTSALTLEVELTDSGSLQMTNILQSIFTFTAQVFHNTDKKNFRHLGKFLSELASIDKLNFLYQQDEESAMDMCARYAKNLQNDLLMIGSEWCLRGFPDWNEPGGVRESGDAKLWWDAKGRDFITFVDSHIRLDNFNIVLLSDNKSFCTFVDAGDLTFEEDLNYKFKYARTRLNFKWDAHLGINELHMPLPNPFLPAVAYKPSLIDKALSTTCESTPTDFVTRNLSHIRAPKKIEGTATKVPTWHKQELSLGFAARTYITLNINSNLDSNALSTTSLELLTQMVYDKVQMLLYSSEIINYTWEFRPLDSNSMSITISGFTDGIEKILRVIWDAIYAEVDVYNEADLEKARENIRSKILKVKEENGLVRGTLGISLALEPNVFDPDLKLKHIKEITLESFQVQIERFQNTSTYKIFYQGDIEIGQCVDLNHSIFGDRHRPEAQFRARSSRTHVIPEGGDFYLQSDSSPEDSTNSVVAFYQTGLRANKVNFSMTSFLAYLISNNLVADLRGKKQLGYAVIGGLRILKDTIGIHIGIISGDFRPEVLADKIDMHFMELYKRFQTMSQKQFTAELTKFLDSYLSDSWRVSGSGGEANLSISMKSLTSSSNLNTVSDTYKQHRRCWEALVAGTDDQVEVQLVRDLTKGEFLRFFHSKLIIESEHRSRLSVYIMSRMTDAEKVKSRLAEQLKFFLKLNQLSIPDDKLDQIIKDSNYNPSAVMPKLIKYFAANGYTLKIMSLLSREVSKALFRSFKYTESTSQMDISSPTARVEITDPYRFKTAEII